MIDWLAAAVGAATLNKLGETDLTEQFEALHLIAKNKMQFEHFHEENLNLVTEDTANKLSSWLTRGPGPVAKLVDNLCGPETSANVEAWFEAQRRSKVFEYCKDANTIYITLTTQIKQFDLECSDLV